MTNPTVRAAAARRGIWLAYFTIAYNFAESVLSLGAGLVAGSVALVGLGIDSAIKVTPALAARRRLGRDSIRQGVKESRRHIRQGAVGNSSARTSIDDSRRARAPPS